VKEGLRETILKSYRELGNARKILEEMDKMPKGE
jgi:hypothetical protein